MLQLLTWKEMKFLLNDYQKNWKTLLINGKSNILILSWTFHSIHTLVKLVDNENITNEKSRILDLSLEIINVTLKMNL